MTTAVQHSRSEQIDGPDQLASLVRRCIADHTPIIDYGVAHSHLGNPPPQPHVRLTQRGSVIEHYERDMTVRVAAGCTLGGLQDLLKPTRQFLPVDADDDVTIGEIVTHYMYGPLRAGFGSVRDLLLGLHYIDGLARDIHVGGRTVKNVAGYDVTRFMVGSLGELGLIHEVTIRTYAIPEQWMVVEITLSRPSLIDDALTGWFVSDAAPQQMSMSLMGNHWTIRIGYTGRSSVCMGQLRSLETLLDRLPNVRLVGSNNLSHERDTSRRTIERAWRRQVPALVKLVVPPARTGISCETISDWAGTMNVALNIDALPIHGCIFIGGRLDAAQARQLDDLIMRVMHQHAGFRVWHVRPDPLEAIQPFAPAQSDWPMLRKLKLTFDPHGLFNPGRFLPAERK